MLLGRAPVLLGEDERAYAELLARIRADVRPKNILEEFWVKDVVDLLWETLRLRRMKASLVTVATRDALETVLAPIMNRSEPGDADVFDILRKITPAQELAAGWYRRDAKAVAEVEKIITRADLSMDIVTAVAFGRSLDNVERIERMIVSAETRRSAVLREVARHRTALAEELSRSSRVREAEYTELGRP
ncbi:hypothetical protein [Falsiroseomonas sp. HW251]|uniref:hypothetical protein n=1 Tax=Falsiroseomonas sp. HW251 TaxID=3390998 RepID=UPI003D31B2A0